jgi:hypothetical protein
VEAVVAILQEQLRAYGFASVKVYTTYIHALIKASGKGKPGVPLALDTWRRLDASTKKPKPATKGKGGRRRRAAGSSSSSIDRGGEGAEGGGGGGSRGVDELVYDGWLRMKATRQPLDAQAYLAGESSGWSSCYGDMGGVMMEVHACYARNDDTCE